MCSLFILHLRVFISSLNESSGFQLLAFIPAVLAAVGNSPGGAGGEAPSPEPHTWSVSSNSAFAQLINHQR